MLLQYHFYNGECNLNPKLSLLNLPNKLNKGGKGERLGSRLPLTPRGWSGPTFTFPWRHKFFHDELVPSKGSLALLRGGKMLIWTSRASVHRNKRDYFFLNCLNRGCLFLDCFAPLLYSRYIMSSAPDMDAMEPCRRDTSEFWNHHGMLISKTIKLFQL